MKHSIRFIQCQYHPSGKGESIVVLRGMELREYPYSRKNAHKIARLTGDDTLWDVKHLTLSVDMSRKYNLLNVLDKE